MPLFKLLPGRPKRIFSSLTCFFGGIFFRELAYNRRRYGCVGRGWNDGLNGARGEVNAGLAAA